MNEAITLLTGPEEAPFLEAKLRTGKTEIGVLIAHTKQELIGLCRQEGFRDTPNPRLIAFCTNVIVPAPELALFRGGAYNFHPGPPEYPGSHASSFAIYEQSETYGVTAHEMKDTVDSGAIVGIERFSVPPDARFVDLEMLAYQKLLDLFDRLVPAMVDTNCPLPHLDVQWSGVKRTRKDMERLKQTTPDLSEEEIRRRWRAFG